MSEKMDIKNLKEVVDLGLAGVSIYNQAMADGKISANDAALLLQLVPVIPPAIEDIDKVPAELKDLSLEEGTELAAHVMAKLNVSSEKAQKLVQAGLYVGIGILKGIQAFQEPAQPVQP